MSLFNPNRYICDCTPVRPYSQEDVKQNKTRKCDRRDCHRLQHVKCSSEQVKGSLRSDQWLCDRCWDEAEHRDAIKKSQAVAREKAQNEADEARRKRRREQAAARKRKRDVEAGAVFDEDGDEEAEKSKRAGKKMIERAAEQVRARAKLEQAEEAEKKRRQQQRATLGNVAKEARGATRPVSDDPPPPPSPSPPPPPPSHTRAKPPKPALSKPTPPKHTPPKPAPPKAKHTPSKIEPPRLESSKATLLKAAPPTKSTPSTNTAPRTNPSPSTHSATSARQTPQEIRAAIISKACRQIYWPRYCALGPSDEATDLCNELTRRENSRPVYEPPEDWLELLQSQFEDMLEAARYDNRVKILWEFKDTEGGEYVRDRLISEEVVWVVNRGGYKFRRAELGLLLEVVGIAGKGEFWKP